MAESLVACPSYLNDRGRVIKCQLGDSHDGLRHTAFEKWRTEAETEQITVTITWREWEAVEPAKRRGIGAFCERQAARTCVCTDHCRYDRDEAARRGPSDVQVASKLETTEAAKRSMCPRCGKPPETLNPCSFCKPAKRSSIT